MSESKSLFGDYHKMVDIGARIQAYDQLFMIPTVDSTMQKINPVGCFDFVAENHQNRISRAGEKVLQRFRSFFRK